MIEHAQIAQIEAVERDGWLDIYAAAPAPLRSALGVAQRPVDDGALLICRAIDHLAVPSYANIQRGFRHRLPAPEFAPRVTHECANARRREQ
jgi:hypothetical protein